METVSGQFASELLHHVTEDHRVHVLTEHIKQKPVAHFAPAHYKIYGFLLDQTISHPQQIHAHARREDDDHPVDDGDEGEHGQDDEPEPEEDVDLLVHHVQGKDAHGVVLFEFAGHSVFVEGAFGHPREDLDHGVDAVLLVAVYEGYYLDSKHEEGTVEEAVHQEHLPFKMWHTLFRIHIESNNTTKTIAIM